MTEAHAYVDIDDYIPCQLAAVASVVMRSVATIFQDHFDITIPEWKVMATVARHPGLSGVDVAQYAGLDTVAVSRAVMKLMDSGLVRREFGKEDRRRSILELTEEGRKLYDEVAPMAARLEASLLEDLGEEEIRVLETALKSLSARSREFAEAFELRKSQAAMRRDAARHAPETRRPLISGTIGINHLNGTSRAAAR